MKITEIFQEKESLVAVKTTEVFLEKKAGRCEIKRSFLFLEKRMADRCEINRSIFQKKNCWLL